MKLDHLASVLANDVVADGFARLELFAPDAFLQSVLPGMFAHIKVPGSPDRLLRRPISIMGADPAKGSLSLLVQPKGEGTKLICSLEKGQKLDIVAPLGNPFDPHGAQTVWAVGGGAGIAPMLFFASHYSSLDVTAILGFRSRGQVYAPGEHTVCTDDGSLGFRGTVVDAMSAMSPLPDLIVACGPAPMLKAVRDFALDRGVRCQLSLEQRMGCGYGACLTCACGVARPDGSFSFARVCADGPVFDAAEVIL